MGLDMNAFVKFGDEEPDEFAYWRKHNALHGWMEQLWREKGCPGVEDKQAVFNCVDLDLTLEDLNRLEAAVDGRKLKPTSGCFFGSTDYSEEDWKYYEEEDRKFIALARGYLKEGGQVFYTSWW